MKVRGGEVLGEFQTLVNPATTIPPFIAVLTGITDAMVAAAPRDRVGAAGVPRVRARRGAGRAQRAVRPRGSCAPAASCRACRGRLRVGRHGAARPPGADPRRGAQLQAVDACPPVPCDDDPYHRALADARATVDVLHGLLERLGNLGVQIAGGAADLHRSCLAGAAPQAPSRRRAARRAGRLPVPRRARPGRSTSASPATAHAACGNTSSPPRPRTRMAEMVGIAERVDAVSCAQPLEAEVRELRLIAEHKPRYNRRSRFPEKALWLKLTDEPFPRLSPVRKVARRRRRPTSGRSARRRRPSARWRRCTRPCRCGSARKRLSVRKTAPACVLAGMGRCGAPCEGGVTPSRSTRGRRGRARGAGRTTPRPLLDALRTADGVAVGAGALRGGGRAPRPARRPSCARRRGCSGWPRWPSCAELVAAQPEVRRRVGPGRRTPRPAGRRRVVRTAGRGAAAVRRRAGRDGGDGARRARADARPRRAEEMDCILRWLDQPGRAAGRAATGRGAPPPAAPAGCSTSCPPLMPAGRRRGRSRTSAACDPVHRPARHAV